MDTPTRPGWRVTVYGGDKRLAARLTAPGLDLVVLPSMEKRGRRTLLKQLRAKDTSVLILLAKWLSHSAYHEAMDAANAHDIPVLVAPATMGMSACQRALDSLSESWAARQR